MSQIRVLPKEVSELIAAGEGKATITAITESGDSATCKVTVKAE